MYIVCERPCSGKVRSQGSETTLALGQEALIMRAGVESVLTFCSFHTVSVPLIRWCVVRGQRGARCSRVFTS